MNVEERLVFEFYIIQSSLVLLFDNEAAVGRVL